MPELEKNSDTELGTDPLPKKLGLHETGDSLVEAELARAKRENRTGSVAAFFAFALWGILPVFWKGLDSVNSF